MIILVTKFIIFKVWNKKTIISKIPFNRILV